MFLLECSPLETETRLTEAIRRLRDKKGGPGDENVPLQIKRRALRASANEGRYAEALKRKISVCKNIRLRDELAPMALTSNLEEDTGDVK